MKIAIDVDQVLCESTENLLDMVNSKDNSNYKLEDMKDYFFEWLTPKYDAKEMFEEYLVMLDKNILNLKAINNAKEILNILKDKYELYVLTARDSKVRDRTIEWINNNFGEGIFKEFIFLDETGYDCKSGVCVEKGFDLMIDDAPHVIENVSKKGIQTFVMSWPWNKNILENEKINRVNSWNDIYDRLKNG
ncbi:MAG: hypothetical protein PF569_06705 [Candidatus Woesearchaeota archaeon]|jgi:5'(3')-deoxyribonucleotidase|nr:hypothetical protein [Candidatus Woesearchaeota archaeon]